jgi:hypothetical protein
MSDMGLGDSKPAAPSRPIPSPDPPPAPAARMGLLGGGGGTPIFPNSSRSASPVPGTGLGGGTGRLGAYNSPDLAGPSPVEGGFGCNYIRNMVCLFIYLFFIIFLNLFIHLHQLWIGREYMKTWSL